MRSLMIAALALFAGGPALAQGPLPPLTLNEAIETALRRHPSGQVAAALSDAARARIGQAESGYYPRLFFGAEYIAGSNNGQLAGTIGLPDLMRTSGTGPPNRATEVRRGIHELTPFTTWIFHVGSGIPVYDFGRTRGRVGEATGRALTSEAAERTLRDRIILGVRRAWFAALAAEAIVGVARQSVARLEVYAAQAREMVKRGVRNPIDVPRTAAELARGQLRLIAAQNDMEVARVVLDNAVGAPVVTRYRIVDEPREERIIGMLPDFLAAALQMRPELAELRGRIVANQGRLEAAEGGAYPALIGTAGVNVRAVGGVEQKFNYDAGIILAWPIFEGYLYKKQEEEAKAQLRSLDATTLELRQRIELEVRSAYAILQSAEQSVAAARVAETHATENLKLARARFQAGLSQIIELADGEELFTVAQANVLRAIYDYKSAAANLERAVGRPLPRRTL